MNAFVQENTFLTRTDRHPAATPTAQD